MRRCRQATGAQLCPYHADDRAYWMADSQLALEQSASQAPTNTPGLSLASISPGHAPLTLAASMVSSVSCGGAILRRGTAEGGQLRAASEVQSPSVRAAPGKISQATFQCSQCKQYLPMHLLQTKGTQAWCAAGVSSYSTLARRRSSNLKLKSGGRA